MARTSTSKKSADKKKSQESEKIIPGTVADLIVKTEKLPWKKLVPYQPETLKKTTPERMAKLRRSLLKNGFASPFHVWQRGKKIYLIDGHHRQKAMLELEAQGHSIPEALPCNFLKIRSEEVAKKLVLAFNSHYADLDPGGVLDFIKGMDIEDIQMEFEPFKLNFNLTDVINDETETHAKLADKFLVSPFSVIDLKSGLMLERAKRWRKYGIESELGRDEELTYQVKKIQQNYKGMKTVKGTSTFNPALTEVIYTWFAKPGDRVIDPWAGGSVRGIVAAVQKYKYTGLDIAKKQLEENAKQCKKLKGNHPQYLLKDSSDAASWEGMPEADLMIGCPPYGDLEVYSKNPRDLSNMPPAQFKKAYAQTIQNVFNNLHIDRFAAIVVGDYRDKGVLQDFVSLTIASFVAAGFTYHNEAIILTPIATAAIRAARVFTPSRRLVKVHQNMLIFVKGDPTKATKRLSE